MNQHTEERASLETLVQHYDLTYQALSHLTVARTVHYLTYIFDCGAHEILTKDTTTPIEFASNPRHAGRLASRVLIWFWGGPPEKEEWYSGSLLTLLVDKLFYCMATGLDDVVDKFLETLKSGCHNQAKATKPKITYCTMSRKMVRK